MAQHDLNFANQTFPSMRADMNAALAAMASNNAGATEPAVKVASMLWHDTTTNKLKFRNAANSAWIDLFTISGSVATFEGNSRANNGSAASPSIGFVNFPTSGLFALSGGAVGLSVATAEVLRAAATQLLATVDIVAPSFRANATNGFEGLAADTAAAPSYTWTGDLNTGMFRPGSDVLAFATGGAQRLAIGNDDVTFVSRALIPGGSAALPGIAFAAASTTGLFRNGSTMRVAVSGEEVLAITTSRIQAQGAAVFSGDGSLLDNLSVAAVQAAIRQFELGSPGSYAWLARKTAGSIAAGQTFAGTSLQYAGVLKESGSADAAGNGVSPPGTWMALGAMPSASGSLQSTLFLRV